MINRYVKISQALLADGLHEATALRFLDVVRRERILRACARRVTLNPESANPLRRIKFTPPLSVVGGEPRTIEAARQMVMAGCPIALFNGVSGRSQGTSIAETVRRLSRIGVNVDQAGALKLYRDLLDARDLAGHDQIRIARIPRFLARIAMVRNDLMRKLHDIVTAPMPERFSFVIRPRAMRVALRDSADRYPDDVPVGMRNGQLVIGGIATRSQYAKGEGLAFLPRRRLRKILKPAQWCVLLTIFTNGWSYYVDMKHADYVPFGGNDDADHQHAPDQSPADPAQESDGDA